MGRTHGKCQVCDDGREMKLANLYRHMRIIHNYDEKQIDGIKESFRPQRDDLPSTKYECPHCDMSYMNKSSLNRHVKVAFC